MYWSQVRILAGPPLTKMNDPRFKIIKNYKAGDKINISNTFESGIKLDSWHINHYFHFIEVLLGIWAHSQKMNKIQAIISPEKLNDPFAELLKIAFPNSKVIDNKNCFIQECMIVDRFEKDLGIEKVNLNKMLSNSLKICNENYEKLKKIFFKHFNIIEKKPPKNIKELKCIFVMRNSPRNLSNHENFINYLEKKNNIQAEIVWFEKLSLKDQMALVANTDILIGVHGNGLTNLLWLPEHGATVEIFGNYHHYDYQILSEIAGTEYFGFLNDIKEDIIFTKGTRFKDAIGSTNRPVVNLKLELFEKGFNNILTRMIS